MGSLLGGGNMFKANPNITVLLALHKTILAAILLEKFSETFLQ